MPCGTGIAPPASDATPDPCSLSLQNQTVRPVHRVFLAKPERKQNANKASSLVLRRSRPCCSGHLSGMTNLPAARAERPLSDQLADPCQSAGVPTEMRRFRSLEVRGLTRQIDPTCMVT
jgi:hypothetical protein